MSLAEPWEMITGVRVRVPAKINLALCVGGKRPDGYHELATLFQAVSLYDEVTAISSDSGVTCGVLGPEAHKIGPTNQNLAYRAARLLQQEYGVSDGVDILIDKKIPVAGGMAGGSADAAGALVACAQLWGLPADINDLLTLGARLGADVPFALMGGCAIGLGKGEILTPALSRGTFHWVLAISQRELSTPEAYQRFDRLTAGHDIPAPTVPPGLMMALASGDAARVGALLVNDLTPASCSIAPELRTTVSLGREAGCLGAIISGSGPTVAFLTENESAATDLAVALSTQGAVFQIRRATGPVPGATVLNS